jgi:transposase
MDAVLDKDVKAVSLPVDLAACHAMIGQLLDQNHHLQRNNSQLEHQLEQLLRKLYGRSSEKLDPNQLALFAELLGQLQSQPPAPSAPVEAPPVATVSRPVKTPHGRRQFPANLPRKRIEHDLPEHEKNCPCCAKRRKKIGEVVTEKLEYVPAKVVVLEIVQFKYGCVDCEQEAKSPQIVLAEKPPEAIEKCMAGPGLLAHVIVGKYSDHLPLHRLEKILARHDIDIARSTMCDWMAGCAAALRPLYDLMKIQVLKSKVIHTDDTPVDVLDKNRRETRTGRFWDYLGDREHPYIVFDYTPSRSRDGPVKFIGDWGKNSKVYLQADAFGGYDGIYIAPASDPRVTDARAPAASTISMPDMILAPAGDSSKIDAPMPPAVATSDPMGVPDAPPADNVLPAPCAVDAPIESAAPVDHGPTRVDRASLLINAFLSAIVALKTGIVEVACWAHARRKFYEARNSDPARSAQAMAYVRLLYDVEDLAKAKQLNSAARAALRRQLALPRLAQFKAWLETQHVSGGGAVLPKSPMGQAITYTLNQWDALCVYVSDGDLAIDNNAGENALRRIGVGRKNWLFCGSDTGGHTAAILFSLIATCDRQKVNPFEYLRDVLERIASQPISRLAELLPAQWKATAVAPALPGG